MERTQDEAGEEVLARQRRPLRVIDVGVRLGYEQTLEGIEAEEGREEASDGGQVAPRCAPAPRQSRASSDPCTSPWASVRVRPTIIKEKNTPMESTMPVFINAAWIPAAPPR